jgi:hypothetical protein
MNKLKRVGSNMDIIVDKVVKENTQEIIDVNEIQLDEGVNYEDNIVGTYANATQNIAETESPKPNKSKEAGAIYNFDWTGDLIKGIFISYRNNVISFDSRGKGDALKKAWIENNKLLGTTDKGAWEINYLIILPDLQKAINKILSK